jgi:hypothetical protein
VGVWEGGGAAAVAASSCLPSRPLDDRQDWWIRILNDPGLEDGE